jgi:hypothetical protein
MAEADVKLLKLRARDAEDAQVVSAVLQDSLVPVCDMAYRPDDGQFVMVAQRLRRESKTDVAERICCAVTFRKVTHVKTHGVDAHDAQRILDLLALMPEGEGFSALTLIFAGDTRIRVVLENGGDVLIEDFGEAWPVAATPAHENA